MRFRNVKNYLYLAKHFRNSFALIDSLRHSTICTEAVEWSGARLTHPQRKGFLGTLVELWIDECYPSEFYEPREGDVVVDAGAHVGLFSIKMARSASPPRVIAIEPFAENFDCLVENLKATGLVVVEPVRAAVGGRAGTGIVKATKNTSIDHRLSECDGDLPDSVPILSLGRLVDMAGGRVALLKMDVEGAEHDAFDCASQETIDRIDRVAMEYHDNLVPGTLSLLLDRLGGTHSVTVKPVDERGYGILLARHRRLGMAA